MGDEKKVISITIAYFDLGQGKDYIYHGTTVFNGIQKGDILGLSDKQVRTTWDAEQEKWYISIVDVVAVLTESREVRKELTDEWKSRGLKEGQQFVTLTDIITKAWTGKTTKEYKVLKGLKKENLRDNDQYRIDIEHACRSFNQRPFVYSK